MKNLTHNRSRDKLLPKLANSASMAGALFLIGVISRIPFQSHMLHHWDSVNFALGMEQFDVRLHQPHPPGYLLYVMLGRLVDLLVRDANTSLVWISIVFGGLTISAIYLLGRRLFGRTEATVAALFALTSPAFWFYGEVALTYILEAFFVTAIALTCLETLRGNRRMAFLAAFLMGLAGGIRQTTLVLMLPLWLFSLLRCQWRIITISVLLLGLTVLAWLAPTIILSGGVNPYLEASRSIGSGVLADFELFSSDKPLINLLAPFIRSGMYHVYGLMLGLVPLLYGGIKSLLNLRTCLNQWQSSDRIQIIALWLIPNLLLYAPLARAPGHTFSFLPALVLLTAAAVTMLSRDLSRWLSQSAARYTISLTGLILVGNALFFLAAPPFLLGIQRVVTTTPSWPTIRHRDQYLTERVDYTTQRFNPTTTIILTAGPDYRHPDYYLRDYASLNYDTESFLSNVPVGAQTLVLFSDTLTSQQGNAQSVVLPGGELLYLQLNANSAILVEESVVSIQPSEE